MKKRGVFVFFVLAVFFLVLVAMVVSADSTNQTAVDKAYSCLNNKTSTTSQCSSLSTEEKTFVVLATGQCKNELMSDSSNDGQCWPSSSCTVKATAEAVIALKNSGSDTQAAQDWLTSKNMTAPGMTWYLEIESQNSTSCNIGYSGQSFIVSMDENKQLSSGAGGCLSLSSDGYLLVVSPSCYGRDITVSCDRDFLTTTLFQKATSSTLYVSETTSSAASGGTTTENVKSYCLADKGVCSYEGTLWGSIALNSLGVDVSSYLPYLITMAEDNQRLLPDSFLYALTAKDDYKTSLLSQQKSGEYWMESGDKYYDTAVALYPLQQEDPPEKENAMTWLLGSQDSQGCWQGNVRDTAFILASVWPKTVSSGTPASPDCQSAGYYCTTQASCTGSFMTDYSCPSSLNVCCSQPIQSQTCNEQGGVLCSSSQQCIGGTLTDASDAVYPQTCCIDGGTCQTPTVSDCESYGGICRAGGCNLDEQDSGYNCAISSDSCCVASSQPASSGGSSLWIWILVVLIVLVVLGILFRKKLREAWQKMRKKKSEGGPSGPFFRPFSPPPRYFPPSRPPERRIIPHPQPRPQPPARRAPSKSQKELDEVLKKLKDMGK